MHNRWIHSIAVACLLSTLCLMPAMAQDQASAEATAKMTFSDEELKSFIFANAGLYQVQQQARDVHFRHGCPPAGRAVTAAPRP